MLDAAGRLFGAHRFHEVRMEDIAAEAEVGKGTLYRYFSDKEELYLALLERASQQLICRLEACKRTATPRDRLRAIVAAILDFFEEQPHLSDLIQRAEVLRDPNRAFPWQKTREKQAHLIVELFEEAKARGDFVVRDPDLAVWMLLGAMRGVFRFAKSPRPADLADRIVDTFLRGAGASRPSVPNSDRARV